MNVKNIIYIMADNYLERQYELYIEKKAAAEKSRRTGKPIKRKISVKKEIISEKRLSKEELLAEIKKIQNIEGAGKKVHI